MSATNLFIGWTGCKFTPTGGSVKNITKVTHCKLNKDAKPETFKGDLAVFVQAIAMPEMRRVITVTSGDVAALLGIVQGADGAFEVELADAKNGITATGGAIKIALTNCVVTDNTADGAHAKFGSAQITFEGYAADGATDPMVVTAL